MDPNKQALEHGQRIFETEPEDEKEEGDFDPPDLAEEYQYADDDRVNFPERHSFRRDGYG